MLEPLKMQMSGQVLMQGQKFWAKFDTFTLIYQVKSLDAPLKEEKDQKRRSSPFPR